MNAWVKQYWKELLITGVVGFFSLVIAGLVGYYEGKYAFIQDINELKNKVGQLEKENNSQKTTIDNNSSVAKEAKNNSEEAKKNSEVALSKAEAWPAGTYCVLKKGNNCPDKFLLSSLDFDTEDNNGNNSIVGETPTMDFATNNVKLYFCCKID